MRAGILFLVAAARLWACSCASYAKVPACSAFPSAGIVFRAKVIESNYSDHQGGVARLRVEEIFKGLAVGTSDVFMWTEDMCARDFTQGRDYIVYLPAVEKRQTLATARAFVDGWRQNPERQRNHPVRALLDNWKDFDAEPLFVDGICSATRELDPDDADLPYLRKAAQGQLGRTGWIQGAALQNYGRAFDQSDYFPVSGATLTARGGGRSWTATSLSDGSFLMPNLPPGAYDLSMVSQIFGIAEFFLRQSHVEVSAGGCAAVLATFATNSTISGTVLDSNGHPAPEVRVELGRIENGKPRSIPTAFAHTNIKWTIRDAKCSDGERGPGKQLKWGTG